MKYFLYGIIGAFLLAVFTEVYATERPSPEKLHAAVTVLEGSPRDVLEYCEAEQPDTVENCMRSMYLNAADALATEMFYQGFEKGYEALTQEEDKPQSFKF